MDHPSDPPPGLPESAGPSPDRRAVTTTGLAMTGGLLAGYGFFAYIAARFLYPSRGTTTGWMFVSALDAFPVGTSRRFRTPEGRTINITRRRSEGTAGDFVALSSVCPHLGCQVHWEPQNERYFCPCHNGTFDPEGIATGGPPGDAGQRLPRFPLRVDKGLLYIEVPFESLAHALEPLPDPGPRGPGHDPCLQPPSFREPI